MQLLECNNRILDVSLWSAGGSPWGHDFRTQLRVTNSHPAGGDLAH